LKDCETLFALSFDFPSTLNLGGKLRNPAQGFEVLPSLRQIDKPTVPKNPTTAETWTKILAQEGLVTGSCVEHGNEPVRWPVVDYLIQNDPATALKLAHFQATVIGRNETEDVSVQPVTSDTCVANLLAGIRTHLCGPPQF
jgi:hypothetical protein